jgi:hypothetical protein
MRVMISGKKAAEIPHGRWRGPHVAGNGKGRILCSEQVTKPAPGVAYLSHPLCSLSIFGKEILPSPMRLNYRAIS